MNLEEIAKRIEELQTQRVTIEDEIEILEKQNQIMKAAQFVLDLNGTKWEIEKYDSMYYSPDNKKKLRINYLHIYPHGRINLTKDLDLICDDNTLIIRTNLCNKTYKDNPEDKNLYTRVLLDFCKANNLTISVYQYENEITVAKRQIENITNKINFIKETMSIDTPKG